MWVLLYSTFLPENVFKNFDLDLYFIISTVYTFIFRHRVCRIKQTKLTQEKLPGLCSKFRQLYFAQSSLD